LESAIWDQAETTELNVLPGTGDTTSPPQKTTLRASADSTQLYVRVEAEWTAEPDEAIAFGELHFEKDQ
jgi:hypothetical protein